MPAQGGDGVVLSLGGHVQELHGEGAGGRVGTQGGVGMEQRLDQGADLGGLAEMGREQGRGEGLGAVADEAQGVELLTVARGRHEPGPAGGARSSRSAY